jgi:hypothetical protein
LQTTDFSTFSNFDIIGDIHGYGTALEILLERMGYSEKEPYNFTHPENRKVLFIGDYIDRGEEILKTLRIVRTMQENGNAIAIMGNHEFNFLCYHYTDEHGESFRPIDKKTHGERKTDSELVDEKNAYLNWMSELPLTFENEYLRAVHAHWDKKSIALIQERGVDKLDRDGLLAIHADEELLQAYEIVLKGDELEIDEEFRFPDKEGKVRKEGRIKWWATEQGATLGECFASIPKESLHKPYISKAEEFVLHYGHHEKPVFFGHYWLDHTEINIQRTNVCCIDFSVAKEGLLVGYRFSGEQTLMSENLVHH